MRRQRAERTFTAPSREYRGARGALAWIVGMAASLLLLLGADGARAAEPAPAPAGRPNIVMIVSDDQGYTDLGCFGNGVIRTPNLDRLAAGGVKLTSFYVTWPACTPSRGSILTGRYPQRNGLYDMIRNDVTDYGRRMDEYEYAVSPEMTIGLDVREVTIAQALKAAGYATGAIGKWDSGRARRFLPMQRGFDSFYGFANTGIDYWTHERYGVPSLFRDNQRIKEDGYATDLFRREAVRFIEEHRRGGGGGERPFFLYLAFNAPHGPSNLERTGPQAPEESIRQYADAGLDPKAGQTRYMACVTRLDDAIGEVLETLRKLGLEEQTLVFFCSDNGGTGTGRNGPLRATKTTLFEGGLRVPAIARWPGTIPAGTTRNDFLTTLELFPTFLAAARSAPPAGVILDGFDMTRVLRGTEPSRRVEMFWEHRADRAARVGRYKWVDSAQASGVYDLEQDLGESHDLSAERPELLAELKARFAEWKKTMDAAEPRGPFRDY